MKGYDLDGVITTGKYKPGFNDVIITSNTPLNFAHVMIVMKEQKIACAVYFNPYLQHNDELSAQWKSEIINKLGCSEYYEDDIIHYEIIKKNCPSCTVIKV